MAATNKSLCSTMEDCEISFPTENYLNWPKKKNDIMLNIANAKSNDLADQTPTPTRFIRNCEELGLFQDLQNVNPFDEMFKKAAESPKSSLLSVPAATQSDDTLHTPHILPQDAETSDNNFNLNISSSSDELVIQIDDDTESTENKNVKNKLRDTIINNTNKSSNSIIKINSSTEKEILVVKPVAKTADSSKSKDNEKIERIREMNRAAQLRCRKKRQIRINRLESEYEKLQEENKRLRLENYNIKAENLKLKEYTLKLRDENANLKKGHDHLKELLSKLKNLLDSDPVLKVEEEVIEDTNINFFTEPATLTASSIQIVHTNTVNFMKESLPVSNERTRPLILRKIMPKY